MQLNTPDSPKGLRETLCEAQALISTWYPVGYANHIARLQRLIDECDRHRPLGPDGVHGDRHTSTCGCEDKNSGFLQIRIVEYGHVFNYIDEVADELGITAIEMYDILTGTKKNYTGYTFEWVR